MIHASSNKKKRRGDALRQRSQGEQEGEAATPLVGYLHAQGSRLSD